MDSMKELNLILFIMNALIVVLIGVMLAILPYITRKSLLFGVRVPEMAHSLPEVRQMKRFFAMIMLLIMIVLLAAALVQYLFWPEYSLLASLYLPLAILPIQFLVYLPLWQKAGRLKRQYHWLIPDVSTAETRSASSRERFGGLPWIWYLGSVGLCFLAVLFSLMVYPSVPDIVVTHWNGAMEADSWAAKSIGLVLAMPLVSLAMIGLMLGCNLIVYRMKLQVSLENPALSYAQHRVYRRLMSHMLGFITLCISLMFLVFQPMVLNIWIPNGQFMLGVILIPTVLMVIPPVLLSWKAGQAGNKLKPVITDADVAAAGYPTPESQKTRRVYSDDRFWKLGMFYFNREDPALFVEDRFGNNGGLNYARPVALILAALLLILVLVTYIGCTILFVRML